MGNQSCCYEEPTLVAASRSGDAASVVKILTECPKEDMNERGLLGETPLFAASLHGEVEIVRILLKEGAVDVNRACVAGGVLLTPLRVICEGAIESQVRTKRARDRATSKDTKARMLKIAKMLLAEPNIDPNLGDSAFGFTPLHVACRRRSHALVSLLLEHPKTDPNKGDKYENKPSLCYVAGEGDLGSAELLLAHRNVVVDRGCLRGKTPLMCAAEGGHVEMVRRLLTFGADDGAKDDRGRTAFDAAQMLQEKATTEDERASAKLVAELLAS
jgi:ankyrin repeat protein